jgi:cytochrome c biogenesis protein ResB
MTPRSLLSHFGSLRATLAGLGLFAAVLLARLASGTLSTAALGGVMGLLSVNLLVALWAHPSFRRKLPLLVAHLALLAVVLLVGVGRLLSLEGRFELTQGEPFDGRLMDGESGPWHQERLQRLGLRHEGFQIDYAPGRKRGSTRNPVSWHDEDGQAQHAVIGDHRPARVAGYRIYTSPNKGFAPLLTWLPQAGQAEQGSVHLPSFPAQELHQSREWNLPDGRAVWVQLQVEEVLMDPATATRFEMPRAHVLVARVGDRRAELRPGDRMSLEGGTLVYEGLRTWMGYRITYDPTLPWLLASSLLAAGALAWHYARRWFLAPRQAAMASRARGPRHLTEAGDG